MMPRRTPYVVPLAPKAGGRDQLGLSYPSADAAAALRSIASPEVKS
jgi:hypothetical protein